eukprot:jgi/Mesvir1/18588/Mv17097-RA.1
MVSLQDSLPLQYEDGLYYYYRLVHPDFHYQPRFSIPPRNLVRVRKSDMKVNGPELGVAGYEDEDTFQRFLCDGNMRQYILNISKLGAPVTSYSIIKAKGHSFRLPSTVVEACDCTGGDCNGVWIHLKVARKFAEWINPKLFAIVGYWSNKLEADHPDVFGSDGILLAPYETGLKWDHEHFDQDRVSSSDDNDANEQAPNTAASPADPVDSSPAGDNGGEAQPLDTPVDPAEPVTSSDTTIKEAADPDRPAARAQELPPDRDVVLKLKEMEKQTELRLKEMEKQTELKIEEMSKASMARLADISDQRRFKRARHMVDMLNLYKEAVDSSGPVTMNGEERRQCDRLFKRALFDALGDSESVVESSQ